MHSSFRSIRLYLSLVLAVWAVVSCYKGPGLSPSTLSPLYTLPQGNASYDDSIVAFNKQYGTYILYKFTYKDFAYNITSYLQDTAYAPASAYIGSGLNFLYTQCFNYYPADFLKQTLPFKIILASRIDSVILGGGAYTRSTGFVAGTSMFAIGCVDSTLSGKSVKELAAMKGRLNRIYWEQALNRSMVNIPDSFLVLAPAYNYVTAANKYSKGVVSLNNGNLNTSTDLLGYIEMITSTPKPTLDTTFLKPSIDVNGLIRQRYNIITSYYRNKLKVDLQAIGGD